MSATLALQVAMVAGLRAYVPLAALLGGAKVFDDVPQGTEPPYVALSDIETRDWSTQTSLGHEHLVTLGAWTRGAGRKQALEIMAAIEAALTTVAPAGYRIVSQRTKLQTVRRGPGLDIYHGIMRLRLVTETI